MRQQLAQQIENGFEELLRMFGLNEHEVLLEIGVLKDGVVAAKRRLTKNLREQIARRRLSLRGNPDHKTVAVVRARRRRNHHRQHRRLPRLGAGHVGGLQEVGEIFESARPAEQL